MERAFVTADLAGARKAFSDLVSDLPRLAAALARQAERTAAGKPVGLLGVAWALDAGNLEKARKTYDSLTQGLS